MGRAYYHYTTTPLKRPRCMEKDQNGENENHNMEEDQNGDNKDQNMKKDHKCDNKDQNTDKDKNGGDKK